MALPKILLGVLLVAVTGCAAGVQSSGSAELDVPEVGVEARRLVVPFDTYKLSTLDLHAIHHAEDLLTRDCMRRQGHDWIVVPPPASEDPDPVNRRRYGLIEPELAGRFGYHLPPPSGEMAVRQSVRDQREQLPAQESLAAYGVNGDGGCRGAARGRLREDIPAIDQSRLNDYSSEAFQASREHPDVREVIRRWSDCVYATGTRYVDPFEAHADPAWAESARPSEREIQVARADVSCKQEHDLIGVWSRVEHEIQQQVVQANPVDFEGFLAAKTIELDAARLVVDQHG